uniref:EF-hand domain-containing protein n=1 Tax=Romanomermis culicivorax TaxID=13658 RepID=A0A915LBY5_ROMCU
MLFDDYSSGTGGASISNALERKLGKNLVAVVEPSEVHYYQGTWTLIGAGAEPFHQCHKPMSEILTNSTWLKDSVQDFNPKSKLVQLQSGEELRYDALIIALGLQLKYDLNRKCDQANVMYCTPTNFMFGVKAYNKPLEDICDKRSIICHYGYTLVEEKPHDHEAISDVKNVKGVFVEKKTIKFNSYASCPLVTGYGKGIMPKFDYSMTPWETFLFLDQLKERRLFYFIKADLLPILYWRGLVRLSNPFYGILMLMIDHSATGIINFDDFAQLCITLTAAFHQKVNDLDIITIHYKEF